MVSGWRDFALWQFVCVGSNTSSLAALFCLLGAVDTKIPITSIRPKRNNGQFPLIEDAKPSGSFPMVGAVAVEVDEERGEVPVASGDDEKRGGAASPVEAEEEDLAKIGGEEVSIDSKSGARPVADSGVPAGDEEAPLSTSDVVLPEMAFAGNTVPPGSTKVDLSNKPPPKLLEHMQSLEDVENRSLDSPYVDVDEQRKRDQRGRRKRWILGGSVLVALAILAAVLGVILSRDNNSFPSSVTETNVAPSAAPPPQTLKDLIASASLDGGAALSDPLSPQSKALTWLEGNGNIDNYPDWRKIQRHTLATFYYSTNGDGWIERDGWLTVEHECDWFTWSVEPTCDKNGVFRHLALFDNNVTGTLPKDLAILSDSLHTLALRDAPLTGTIPTEISLLTKLGE